MKKVNLAITENLIGILGLTNSSATEDDVVNGIVNLSKKAARVDELQQKYDAEKAEKEQLKNKLEAQEKDTAKDKCKAILDKAQEEGKVTNEMRTVYEKQYADKPTELEELINVLTPQGKIERKITTETSNKSKTELAKEFDELDMNGGLENVAKEDPDRYRELYNAKYNVDPTNVPS